MRVFAHELGHKKETSERWLAKITLAPTFYGHFYIEHNRGHHVVTWVLNGRPRTAEGSTLATALKRAVRASGSQSVAAGAAA